MDATHKQTISYAYMTSRKAIGCSFDTAEKAQAWFKDIQARFPSIAKFYEPVKITNTITVEVGHD